jgi:hypothetical protein
LLVAASCVAAVVLSTSVAFAKPLSEQQWRKQANVICKQSNEDLNAIANEAFSGLGANDEPTAEQYAAFVDQGGPSLRASLDSIDALNEPKALKKDVKKLLGATLAALATMEADPSLDSDAVFAKPTKLAKQLGLVCGS